MMTASELVKSSESFPTLTGDIVKDTDTIIGELAVGTYVVERGLARLYMVWKSKSFLDITTTEFTCKVCGLQYTGEEFTNDEICPKCDNMNMLVQHQPMYPTLELYLAFVSDQTGKSRQTLFNRLKVYRVLCDERGVTPESVFRLTLLSSGAASKLASADDGANNIKLENDSWQDTVDTALSVGTKSGALQYVKYDVLLETRITSAYKSTDNSITVYREYNDNENDQFVLEEFHFKLDGSWPDQVTEWLIKRLGAKIE